MRDFTIYTSNYKGNFSNCLYPNKILVRDETSFIEAISFDHVSGLFKDDYRSVDNFIKADNLVLDCDNDHSDNPEDWVSSLDLAMAFSGVTYAISYSRNHQKKKGDKTARPRFHVYFPVPEISDKEEYLKLKQSIVAYFPFFDANALDSARFIFATDQQDVEIYTGDLDIIEFLKGEESDAFYDFEASQEEIPEGSRNTTMSRYAGRIIKRFGPSDEAYAQFLKQAEKCNPPLAEKELKLIWKSAVTFGKKVEKQADYIAPEVYNQEIKLKPSEYSDIGQAEVFVREYETKVRYSPATNYLVYNGSFWEESDLKAQGLSQDLANRQVKEADALIKKAQDEMKKNGALDLLNSLSSKKAISLFSKAQSISYNHYLIADNYKKYAIKRGDTRAIHATTKEAMPMLEIKQEDLDVNGFLLNTPSCTIDLKTGRKLDHSPDHFITKETAVDPDNENSKLWLPEIVFLFALDHA